MRRASSVSHWRSRRSAGLEPGLDRAMGRGPQGGRDHQAAARPGRAGDVGGGHARAAGEGRILPAQLCAQALRGTRAHNADLFFRMSETVESFTVKVVKSLPKRVEVVTLQDAPGLKLLALRTGATFEPHAHGKDGARARPSPCQAATRAMPSTATPGSIRTTPRSSSSASSRRSAPGIRSTPPPSRPMPQLLAAKLDALACRARGRAQADRRQALHRLPRCLPVPRAPLRPQRRGLDLDQPRGAAERQAAHRPAPQDPVPGRGVRVRRAGVRSRAWSTT